MTLSSPDTKNLLVIDKEIFTALDPIRQALALALVKKGKVIIESGEPA